MRYTVILVVALHVAMPAIGLTAIIYVPDNYPQIQDAINAAANGDTIIVRPNTYVENIDFIAKDISVKSEMGPKVTVIDGNQAGSVVTIASGEPPSTLLDGFTLTNGSGTIVGSYTYGGGIYCRYSAAPTISNNIIIWNSARYGGGFYCNDNTSPTIINNRFIGNNVIREGAGLYTQSSSPTIHGNVISGNNAYRGGGMLCYSCTNMTVANNVVYDNVANGDHSGGFMVYAGTHTVCNNVIFGNWAQTYGGGIFCDSGSTVVNNTFYNNWAANSAGGIYCKDSPTISNTILWQNTPDQISGGTPSVTYCDVEGGYPGTGNIDADPLFVDPVNNDLHIFYSSPCRDTADSSAPGLPLEDFEGDPRIAYGNADMGADEFHTHLYYTGDASPGGNVSLKFVGLPGTAPVGFFVGTGVLDPPLPSMWGDWYLKFPCMGPLMLAPIPSSGVEIISGSLPGAPPAPYSIPMQAIIGSELTNLCVMMVE